MAEIMYSKAIHAQWQGLGDSLLPVFPVSAAMRFQAVRVPKLFSVIAVMGFSVGLSACAGIGAGYSTPARAQQIPYSVEAITPVLAAKLAVQPPLAVAPPEGTLDVERYTYRIGPTDVLSIFVNQSLYNDQGVPGSDRQAESLYVVSESGEIFIPLHGALKVSGLTIGEAYIAIQRALARFVTRPQVNVRVSDFRSQRIAVAGAVEKPGYFPVTDRPMTITEAVLAAGQTPESDLRKAVLKRGGKDYPVDAFSLIRSPTFGQNWVMQDGDVVYVPKNENRVYVLGEAPNRTEFIDPYDTSLAEVLVSNPKDTLGRIVDPNYLQGGAALNGSIFVVRGNVNGARVYHLNAGSPEAFILADNFQLANGDIVFVSTRPITRLNRFIAQLLPAINSVLGPALIVNTISKN